MRVDPDVVDVWSELITNDHRYQCASDGYSAWMTAHEPMSTIQSLSRDSRSSMDQFTPMCSKKCREPNNKDESCIICEVACTNNSSLFFVKSVCYIR
jgi:hypothetical protein